MRGDCGGADVSILGGLFHRRDPAPPDDIPAVALQRPRSVPEGMTHVEFTTLEAIDAFRREKAEGDPIRALELSEQAIVNLWHALFIALSKREHVDLERAYELLRDGLASSEVWGGL